MNDDYTSLIKEAVNLFIRDWIISNDLLKNEKIFEALIHSNLIQRVQKPNGYDDVKMRLLEEEERRKVIHGIKKGIEYVLRRNPSPYPIPVRQREYSLIGSIDSTTSFYDVPSRKPEEHDILKF